MAYVDCVERYAAINAYAEVTASDLTRAARSACITPFLALEKELTARYRKILRRLDPGPYVRRSLDDCAQLGDGSALEIIVKLRQRPTEPDHSERAVTIPAEHKAL